MPTVIDSLVVKLGLDTSGYDKSQKKVKEANKDTAKSFEDIAGEATKFLAILGGTAAITSFVQNTIASSAALERFSKNIGRNVEEVNAWSGAAEVAGGSAEALQGTLSMLSKAQTEFKLTGNTSMLPFFNALGISAQEAGGSVTDLLSVIHNKILSKGMNRQDAFNMGQMFGIDAGTMNLLLSSDEEFKKLIAYQTKLNKLTEAQAKAFVNLQQGLTRLGQQTNAFGTRLVADLAPALEKAIDLFERFGDWCKNNGQFVTDFIGILGTALALLGLKALPITLTAAALVALAAAIALVADDYQTFLAKGDSEMPWQYLIDQTSEAIEWLDKLLKKMQEIAYNPVTKILGAAGSLWGAVTGNRKDMQAAYAAGSGSNTPSATGSPLSYFMAQGWTKAQAAGIVANLHAESGMNPSAVGDSGKAYGLGQWHPDRQAEFKKLFGKSIQGSSLDEQLAFVQHELTKGNEVGAGARLRGAKTAGEAGSIISRYYERPADVTGEAAKRAGLAQQFMGIPGASQAAMGGGATVGAAGSRSVTINANDMKIYTQATDAEGIMRDAGQSLDYLAVSQANTGQM